MKTSFPAPATRWAASKSPSKCRLSEPPPPALVPGSRRLTRSSSSAETVDPSFQLLLTYYQRFFPWRYMFQWLNHSPVPTNDFKHREFSLWLHNDAVMRYQSYTTSDLSVSL